MGYSVVNVAEIEGSGPGGAVRFVRRTLGVGAFGINWFELQADVEGHAHDEAASGQEEVIVVIRGSGMLRIDGEEISLREGTFVRIDPESRRQPVAGPNGLTFVAVGSRRGSYEPQGPF